MGSSHDPMGHVPWMGQPFPMAGRLGHHLAVCPEKKGTGSV